MSKAETSWDHIEARIPDLPADLNEANINGQLMAEILALEKKRLKAEETNDVTMMHQISLQQLRLFRAVAAIAIKSHQSLMHIVCLADSMPEYVKKSAFAGSHERPSLSHPLMGDVDIISTEARRLIKVSSGSKMSEET